MAQRQYNYPRRGGFRDRQRIPNRGGYNATHRNHIQSSINCQICGKTGHNAKKCYFCFDMFYLESPSLQSKQALAAMGHGSNSWETPWHADTGATHHLTNSSNDLNLQRNDYTGSDSVQVGNEQGLQISKIGSSKITTPYTIFLLSQVLVLEIRQNLLSIHQLCVDNNVYFDFHSFYFLVKDYSGKVRHWGYLHDGLYQFTNHFKSP